MTASENVHDPSATIKQCEGIVRRLAHSLLPRLPVNVEIDDLIQEGLIAIWQCSGKFDPDRGASFETFLTHRARGAMLDYLRGQDPLTRGERNQVRKLERAINGFSRIDRGSLAKTLRLSLVEVEELLLLRAFGHPVSGDTYPEDDEKELTLLDRVATDNSNPVDEMRFKECLAAIERVIEKSYKSSPEIARQVFNRHFLEGEELNEVAEFLGVTESRVCQIAHQIQDMIEYQLRY